MIINLTNVIMSRLERLSYHVRFDNGSTMLLCYTDDYFSALEQFHRFVASCPSNYPFSLFYFEETKVSVSYYSVILKECTSITMELISRYE